MFRLGAEEWPRWITLIPATDDQPAVEVRFAKITRSMKRRAQKEAAELLGEADDGQERDQLELAEAGDAYSMSLIRQGLLEWRGIGDAKGNVIAVSPDAVELFLADDRLFERADELYATPEILRDAEKNGLSASPGGTGGAGTRGRNTASSRAAAKKGAKTANTRSPRRKRQPAKKSGT